VSRVGQWAIFLLAGVAAPAFADSCVWFSHDDSIRQVQTSSNQVTRIVPLRNPHRLLMNAEDCGVWALDKHEHRILRFSTDGAIEREIRVRDLDPRLDEAERLHLDPYDASLWVTDDRRIFRISDLGELLGSFDVPGEIRRLRVGLDQTLWMLGKRDLWHFDSAGNRLATYALGRHLAGNARYFVIDNVGGLIWLADDKEIARLELSNPAGEQPLRIRLQHHITGFTLDPFTGNVWVAQKESLLAFSRAGSLAYSVDLEVLNIRKPEKLGFDPVSRSIWVGAEKSVSRFSDSGQFVVHFSAKDGDEALGVPTFKVQPSLTLIRPPLDALANNPQPEFRLGYGADCNETSCGFPASYFSGYQLTATLNSQSIGSAFQFDVSTIESFFIPSSRLPEGTNSFIAQVNDGFGHSSDSVSNAFTIDTIAPRFLTLSPSDGSVFATPLAMLQGTIDDPQATVVLNGLGLSQSGESFGFPVVLAPGPNSFTLSALDLAGNATTAILRLNLVSVRVTIESPPNGALIAADSLLVTGTYQAPLNAGITVNGVIAATDGNRFYAQVPLKPGPNLLNAVVTSPDGATATQSVTVTSTGPAPVRIVAGSVQGIAPWNVTFSVVSSSGLTRIEADYNGDGMVDFTSTDPKAVLQYTYATPGTYQARFNVTDSQGNTHALTQVIVVVGVASRDAMLRSTFSGMLTRLRAGDIDGALTAFTGSANQKYRAAFTALAPSLPSVVDQLGAIQDGAISSEFAEYSIVRNLPDGQQAFLIYFIRGADGVWRIDGM